MSKPEGLATKLQQTDLLASSLVILMDTAAEPDAFFREIAGTYFKYRGELLRRWVSKKPINHKRCWIVLEVAYPADPSGQVPVKVIADYIIDMSFFEARSNSTSPNSFISDHVRRYDPFQNFLVVFTFPGQVNTPNGIKDAFLYDYYEVPLFGDIQRAKFLGSQSALKPTR